MNLNEMLQAMMESPAAGGWALKQASPNEWSLGPAADAPYWAWLYANEAEKKLAYWAQWDHAWALDMLDELAEENGWEWSWTDKPGWPLPQEEWASAEKKNAEASEWATAIDNAWEENPDMDHDEWEQKYAALADEWLKAH